MSPRRARSWMGAVLGGRARVPRVRQKRGPRTSFRWDALVLVVVVMAVMTAFVLSQRSRRHRAVPGGAQEPGVLLADPVAERAELLDVPWEPPPPGLPETAKSGSISAPSERAKMEKVKAALKAMEEAGELPEGHIPMLRYLCRELGDESCSD